MSLITVEDLKRYHKSETTEDEWLYQQAIAAAEQYLRDETGREIHAADATATERVYHPDRWSDTLWIHDCSSITSVVENGATLTSGTDYIAMPLNNKSAAGAYMPTDRLVRYASTWYFDGPKSTVTVNAKWGWTTASIPPGLKIALYVCAKAYIQTRKIEFGLVGVSEAGGVGERDAKAVKDFIDNYRGHGSWGIA